MNISSTIRTCLLFVCAAWCMSVASPLHASDDRWGLTLGYMMAIPASGAEDFVDRYSWQGVGGELTYLITERDHLALHSGWQRFDVLHRNELTTFTGGAIYGTQIRALTSIPVILKATHTMGDPYDKVRPYASLGAGMYIITQNADIGLYEFNSTNVHVGLMPAVGLNFRLDFRTHLLLQIDYNAALASGLDAFDRPNTTQNYIGLKALLHFGR